MSVDEIQIESQAVLESLQEGDFRLRLKSGRGSGIAV